MHCDLCEKINKGDRDFSNITNCWVKTIGPEYLKNRNQVIKNPYLKASRCK